MSHLHFCYQSYLHFYGIINEDESHLHFLAHHHYTLSRGQRWQGGTSAQEACGSDSNVGVVGLNQSLVCLFCSGETGGSWVGGYNKLWQSNRQEEQGDEFFQVQIEASVSPHIKHTEPGRHSTLWPLKTAAKKIT